MCSARIPAPNGRSVLMDKPNVEVATQVAANVSDPELPYLTLADLGILRSVELQDDIIVAYVSPTYSGCPALEVIEQSVLVALKQAGFNARVERTLSPPWTTDWITDEGRRKLNANGIAPPQQGQTDKNTLFAKTVVVCPACSSDNTAKVSEFGSTPCKAQYQCKQCREPFEYFKCH